MDQKARRELATDLVDTMRASPACVGLAANQIGVTSVPLPSTSPVTGRPGRVTG